MKRLLLVHNLVHGQSVVHELDDKDFAVELVEGCLLYTSPSPRDSRKSRMPSSA